MLDGTKSDKGCWDGCNSLIRIPTKSIDQGDNPWSDPVVYRELTWWVILDTEGKDAERNDCRKVALD